MQKSFADAILTAQEFTTDREKHAALSGLGADEQRLVVEALNTYRIFGIKKWDKPAVYANTDPSFTSFFSLLDALHSRNLTGNAAKSAVTATLGLYTERTAKVLERVLKKDLKCGASSSTFSKIYPNMVIPSYEVMLAQNTPDGYEPFESNDHVIAEIKYDGNRGNLHVENGFVTPLSRSGKIIDGWVGVFDAEMIALEKIVGYPFVLDGEAMAANFSETLKAKGKDSGVALKFFAFDFIPMNDWKAQSHPVKQADRSAKVEELCKKLGSPKIVKSEYKICRNKAELKAMYDKSQEINPATGKPMHEGLIIKTPDGLYTWERGSEWTKWKPSLTVDLKIVGFYNGRAGTRHEEVLGGFICEGVDGASGKFIKVRAGGGLSDKQRKLYWDTRGQLLNRTVEIECKEICQAENAEPGVYSLREPARVTLRTDK